MRDVTEQLTAYFDATVERVTAEDVLAGAEVRSQSGRVEPARVPRLRPAWVVAAGFVATMVAVGGALGVVRLLESDSAGVGTAPPSIGEGGDGLAAPWVMLIAVGLVLLLAVVGLALRDRREIVKEPTMQTLEKPEAEISPRPRSPAILILLVALLVLAAGALGWWIGSSGDDSTAAEVPEIVDKFNQAWVDGDADAVAALYAEDGRFTDVEIDESLTQDLRSVAIGAEIAWHVGRSMAIADFEALSADQVIVLDNVIAYEWTATGMSGSLRSFRDPFESSGLTVLEMEDGLIVSSMLYYNSSEIYNTGVP